MPVGAALERADVRTRAADDGGNFGEQAGTILGANQQFDRERGGVSTAPFNCNAALGLVEEILDVGARAGVNRDAAAAGNVADNVVSRYRVAAFCTKHQQVVLAFDDQGRFAKTEHALDGFDQSRLGVGFGFLRLLGRHAEIAREDLARRKFAESDGGKKVIDLRKSVFRAELLQILVGNFLQTLREIPRFVFEQAAAHLGRFLTLLGVDEMADLALGVGRLDEAEPIAAGLVTFLGENLDHVAAADFVAQRNHLAVHLCAHALVPDLGMNRVGEIDRGRSARQLQDAALWRESVHLDRGKIHFQG